MKKILVLMISLALPLLAGAQAQINTKKIKIEDFTRKITKVVLTGNEFHDSSLRDEIAARWRISPYEFCSAEEFNSLKESEDYYFLLTVSGKFRKENGPGLMFLSLVKGGKNAAAGINEMLEIVSVPLCPTENPSGREAVFLPAFIDIIQQYTLDSMERDLSGYTGLSNYTLNMPKSGGMDIIFAEEDLSSEITRNFRDLHFDSSLYVTDEDSADEYMTDNAPNTLVSYVVTPDDPQPGSYCYKMIISAETHQVYYYRRHRIPKKTGPGFLAEDLKRIISYRGH
ncbi:MAG: hypothetical protein K2H95_09010 [Bacteroidales bacterium]|nr:hypothetical protein [Bacteroidales bacterium]